MKERCLQNNLFRFVIARQNDYQIALQEIRRGYKQTH